MSDLAPTLEPWLDQKGLAEHLACSVRWIRYRMAEGMPHAMIGGRPKYRASEVEAWLEAHGQLEHHGDMADTRLDNQVARQRVIATGP